MTKIIISEASYNDFDIYFEPFLKESICKKLGFDPDTVTLYREEEVRSVSYTYSEV